ncbi:MAG: hypothetical protein HY289_09815 [Planctomycetes bacterium]|nr:hypothetical protein [Planctomycetota bacterium]
MKYRALIMLSVLIFASFSCKPAEQPAAPKDDKKIILLGDGYGMVRVEDLKEITVIGEAEKPADVARVQAKENAPPDRLFDVPAGRYQTYLVKTTEKKLNGKVLTTRELSAGTKIKDLRSVGWIRLDGKTNDGVGAMTGYPVLVMEGTLVGP